MIESDQWRALISPKGTGLRGPVHLVRSSRIGAEVVFRRLMVGDCMGECVRHRKLMVASFESGRLHHQSRRWGGFTCAVKASGGETF